MRRFPLRLVWAVICLVVWPLYYGVVLLRWFVDGLRWLTFRQTLGDISERDRRVIEEARNPPFLGRLRA
jgi:hypothetical protein